MAPRSWHQPIGLPARAPRSWSYIKCGWGRRRRASMSETPETLMMAEGGRQQPPLPPPTVVPGRSRRADQRDVPYMGPLRARSIVALTIPGHHARHARSLGGPDAGEGCSLVRSHQCEHLRQFDDGLPPDSVGSGLGSTTTLGRSVSGHTASGHADHLRS
jgi:hypothetical protein